MNEQSKQEIKDELREELSRELKEHVEDEVEDEVDSLRNGSGALSMFNRFKFYLFAVAATIMALGQFSEAVTLIEDGVNSLRSRFTHTVEYELLASIHVGNTEAYVEERVGHPQVSRSIEEGIVANYFFDEKFLLTVFIGEERVVAYTVIPLITDFTPLIFSSEDEQWLLGESSYERFPANPKLYIVDHSPTASYYLESLDTGRTGLFVQNYLGNVSLGFTPEDPLLIELYEKGVYGTAEEELEAQNRFRSNAHPNFFGEGTLELELIRKSILTGAEFSSYFGRQAL